MTMMTEQEHNNVQWRKVKLGEVAKMFTGLTYSPNCIDKSGTLVLRSSNIKDGQLCFDDNVFVSMDIPERAIVQENDILICVRNGSRNLIGKCALITKDAVGMAFGAFMTVLRSNIIDSKLLLYIWQSNSIQKQVANNIGATINQITNADFNRFEISYPADLSAQRRIAAILSSADKVIAATQKTIAKYKQIKQGMMEDLLKPKEGWKMVKLGEVGEIVTGLTYSPSNVCQEGVLVLRSSNIQDDNLYFEDNVYVDVESFNPVIENDILICVRNGSRALIGKTARITKEVEGCAFGAFMLVYRSNYNDFLYHFFKSDMFFSQVSRNIGATINSINGSDLKNMEVNIPSDPTEQRRIAKILSGIDAKIAAEEKVLEKYEKVKKGLMERLLEGEN